MGRRSSKLESFLAYQGLILIIILILIGLGKSLLISFGIYDEIGINTFTTSYYSSIFNDKTFIESLIFSLKISVISSAIALVVGVFLSYGIFNSKIFDIYLKIPVIIPHIIVVISLVNLFSQTGIISRVLYNLGLLSNSSDFYQMFYDKNAVGVIFTYAFKGAAYAAMVFLEIYRKISINQLYAAKNLGASDLKEFYYVIFPYIKREMLEIFLILFNFSISSYEVPLLIGPTVPRTLAIKSYVEFTKNSFIYKPNAFAINIMLTLIGLLSIILLLIFGVKNDEKDL